MTETVQTNDGIDEQEFGYERVIRHLLKKLGGNKNDKYHTAIHRLYCNHSMGDSPYCSD